MRGSSNSHLAIVARALGIPTVMGAIDVPWTELEGEELIVDGSSGHVVSRASKARRRAYHVCRGKRMRKHLSKTYKNYVMCPVKRLMATALRFGLIQVCVRIQSPP